MNTLFFRWLRRPPFSPPTTEFPWRECLPQRWLVSCLTLSFLAIVVSIDARAGLTLDSGLVTVETNAVHDGNDEDPKSDSALQNTLPGQAGRILRSQKLIGLNAMTANASASLLSGIDGAQIRLTGSAVPRGVCAINDPAGAGTFVGTGRGTATYTFTLNSSYNWFLTWGLAGTLSKTSDGTPVNSTEGNKAAIKFHGLFEQSIIGSETKSGFANGFVGPGTYTVEATAEMIAGNGQTSQANASFALIFVPLNRWINAADGSFQTASNWEAGTVPAGQAGALFDVPGTYTVSLISDVSHNSLDLHGSGVNVTFELDAHSYTLGAPLQIGGPGESVSLTVRGSAGIVSAAAMSGGPMALAVGDDDALSMPELNLKAGSAIRYLDRMKHISQRAAIEGSWALEGLGTFVEVAELNIGILSDDAKLDLSKNAQLLTGNTIIGVNSDSVGVVSLESEALWQVNGNLTVGKEGSGEINLQGNTALTVVGSVLLGVGSASPGLMSVKDGAVLEAQTLVVGQNGLGAFDVGGATAKVDSLQIGAGLLTVSDFGVLNAKSTIQVAGEGTKLLVDGGTLNGDGSPSAIDIGSKGILSVLDGTAFFKSLKVGAGGEASGFTCEFTGTDARVESAGQMSLFDDAILKVKTCRVDGILSIPSTGAASVGDTGDVIPSSVRVNRGGVLSGNGAIIADEIVVTGGGSNLFTGAQIRPGTSPGTLTLDGNFRLESGGELIMEIAGPDAGANHDQLVVTGNASLGGKLILQFTDGFLPKQGDQFALLDIGGSVTGDFESVEISGLEPGFDFDLGPDANGNLVMTALNDGVPQQSKGKYRGLLLTDPSAHATAGFFNLQVSPRHAFVANFVLGGETFRVKGKFDAAGKFTGTVTGKSGTTATVNLVLSLVSDARAVVGTISVGNQTIQVAAEQTSAFNKKNNPAPQAGKYTMLLPFDPQDTDAPKASGYGTVTVAPNGAIRFAGALPDGTRLAQSTVLSKTGEWPLYLLLYHKGGSLAGALKFQDLPGSDFDGALHWTRPPDVAAGASGFVTTLAAVGSEYLAPPARPAVLDFPNGASFTLNNPNQTLLLTKSLSLIPPARFSVINPGGDALSLSVKPAAGLLSGTLIHPSDGKMKVRGVVFQKQNFGTGFGPVSNGAAAFELRANP